jgi:transposase-like protein
MTGKTRNTFSPELKREAVRLLEPGSKEAARLARELGVKRHPLYKWQKEVHQYGDEAFPGHGQRQRRKVTNETAVLKVENRKLREENEILKKAALYFARESG